MNPIPLDVKDSLVLEARALCDSIFDYGGYGRCFGLSLCLLVLARGRGIDLCPQAGSLQWRMVRPELDDGVSPNCFTYLWEPEKSVGALEAAVLAGRLPRVLPEMHVWLGDAARQEVADLATGELPAQVLKLRGYAWRDEAPPPWLWCSTRDVPDAAGYRLDRDASVLAGRLMVAEVRAHPVLRRLARVGA